MKQAENYLKLNNKYLEEAEALMDKGDYVQASEKYWGAAAEMVKAIAARRGKDIRSHEGIYSFVDKLSEELNDPELLRLFGLASALHQNFYENWLSSKMVANYGEAVKELVDRLNKLV
jgi:uncharacterized protein (UPF0332 family)